MFSFYKTQMQVCLDKDQAIALLKLFGHDYFTEINVLNQRYQCLHSNIQYSYMKENRLKLLIKDIKAYDEKDNVFFEFIKK